MRSIAKQWLKVVTKFLASVFKPKTSEVITIYSSDLFSSETLWGPRSAGFSYPRLLWKTATYLFLRKNFTLSPSKHFDSSWYLEQNQDVAASNVHPLLHFIKSGRYEGRLPLPNRTVYIDELLWRGNTSLALTKLNRLLSSNCLLLSEKLYAYWALARWYLYKSENEKAFSYALTLTEFEADWEIGSKLRYRLLCIDCATRAGKLDNAQCWIEKLLEAHPEVPEAYLAKVNVLNATGSLTVGKWLALFNNIFQQRELEYVVAASDELKMASLMRAPARDIAEGPRVSVIVPLYNCQDTIEYVLCCLEQQSWRNLEIIVVNDNSSDASANIVRDWIAQKSSTSSGHLWRLIESETNIGAYGVRNLGMAAATGDYLTVNDADDWAHGQKIELQVAALINSSAVASVSSMVRTLPDLTFYCWRIDDRWIFRNVSSLLIKRTVLEDIGYWDEIKAGADTEYYYRVLKKYGVDAIVHVQPDVPLSLQLVRQDSLTQTINTHVITQFEGPRNWYLEAAFRWHSAAYPNLYMARAPKIRPFICPQKLRVGNTPQPEAHEFEDRVIHSGLWDASWYVQRYKDLQEGGVEPLEHFIRKGRFEGRDPGPNFSCSGYAYCEGTSPGDDPFTHFLSSDKTGGYLPKLKGVRPSSSGANIMLVGHQAGKNLYGAERSLLDLAEALNIAGFNVFALIPEVLNEKYVEQLRSLSVEVRVIPYGWWYEGKEPCTETVEAINGYILECQIEALHVNTLVLDEPIVSARSMNRPFIVHVREDLPSDPALEDALLSSAESVHTRLVECGAKVLCNSEYLLESFRGVLSDFTSFNGSYIYNAVDTEKLKAVLSPSSSRLQVGMISSNVAKKGVSDFFEIVDGMKTDSRIQFKIYGQYTSELKRCLASCTSPYIEYCGYVAEPKQALDNLHVVLSLSLFNESFGRTVAEAQAAGKVAIAYHTGALPELIHNGVTGFTVPFRQVSKIKDILVKLASSPEIVEEVSGRAQSSALERFSRESCSKALLKLYQEILEA